MLACVLTSSNKDMYVCMYVVTMKHYKGNRRGSMRVGSIDQGVRGQNFLAGGGKAYF